MKLIKYLKPYWFIALMTPLFMVIEVVVDLIQPKLMSKIVDEGVLAGNMELIITTGITMMLFVILGGIGGIGSAAFSSATSQSFAMDLRNDVFKKTMHLSFQQTDKFTTGSLVTRLTNDITMVQNLVNQILRMMVRTGMLFVGGIVMVLSLNVKFGLVLAAVLPLQALGTYIVLKKGSPLFKVVQKKLDKVNAVVQENVSGARVVKAYTREDHEKERFYSANEDLIGVTMRVQKLMATAMPLLSILMNITVLLIIYMGGLQVQARQMQVGEVMAAVTYISQILHGVMMFSMMFQVFSRASASASRLIEVLETEPVIHNGSLSLSTEQKEKGTVRFENASFHYPNTTGRPVLQGINLEVRPGEMVAVLGATGSGKSSMVNLVPRFYDTTEGRVLVDGVDVKEYSLDGLREKVGMVLQTSELFAGTILDNIRWGNENATEEEVITAAKIAQADEFIQSFPDGYQTQITQKGASLSGGQKQRLSIARAILKKPEILIFDDSTSALDLGTEARLQKAMRQSLKGTTVIMIAQRVASVMGADRIAVIENGTIADCGSHYELLERSPLYQDIYNSQIRKGEVGNE
jgi:ATP-binding cassette subfamily B protein